MATFQWKYQRAFAPQHRRVHAHGFAGAAPSRGI